MKKIATIALLLSSFVSFSASAATSIVLNNVSYPVTEQQWVKSKGATAIISINATVSDQDIAKLRQSIMSNLQKIASGEWQITQFNRNKTSSGLESVSVSAQIRLPATQLDHIQRRVKNVSQSGQTYTVTALNFNPTPADIAKTQVLLRQKIYGDIKTELKNLNHQFPKEHYFVHQIRFMSGQVMPRTVALIKMPVRPAPNVSQHVTLRAMVVLSSKVKSSNGR